MPDRRDRKPKQMNRTVDTCSSLVTMSQCMKDTEEREERETWTRTRFYTWMKLHTPTKTEEKYNWSGNMLNKVRKSRITLAWKPSQLHEVAAKEKRNCGKETKGLKGLRNRYSIWPEAESTSSSKRERQNEKWHPRKNHVSMYSGRMIGGGGFLTLTAGEGD